MKKLHEIRAAIKENYDGRTRDGRALKRRLEAKMLERTKIALAKEAESDVDAEDSEEEEVIEKVAAANANIVSTLKDDLTEAAALKNVPSAVLKNLGRTDKNQLANIISGKNDLSDRTSERVYDALYDYYSKNGMPYGTASARDGDPYEWILDQIT